MADTACVAFLQWALPRLGMRWRGFRRVHRQVCRRIRARIQVLGLADHAAYRDHLERHAREWDTLDALCRVTISRFFRNERVFRDLPALASELGRDRLRIWSAGCASGEEPYSVVLALSDFDVEVVATDADAHMLDRARTARYQRGTLRELSEEEIASAFVPHGDLFELRAESRDRVCFMQQDVRHDAPEGLFDLILCRNLAFTYFDEAVQRGVVARFAAHTRRGGALIVGAHEAVPEGIDTYVPWAGRPYTHRRTLARAGDGGTA